MTSSSSFRFPRAIRTYHGHPATLVAVVTLLACLAIDLAAPDPVAAYPIYSDGAGEGGTGRAVLGSAPTAFLPPFGPRIALPAILRLPSVGVRMDIESVGATPDGGMDVPQDPSGAGWYRYGARPGEPGNAAIGGHVDYGGKIRPFWYLDKLAIGDPVEIQLSDGTTVTYYVRWERMYDPNDAPLMEIFGSSGVPEVTLITCGGEFDRATRQYLGRFVVRASSVPPR